MDVGIRLQTECPHRRTRLRTPYGSLDVEQRTRLWFAPALGLDYVPHLVEPVAVAEFARSVYVLEYHIVMHRHVARGLVRHMHVMTVFEQPYQRSAHRDYVVVGAAAENTCTRFG